MYNPNNTTFISIFNDFHIINKNTKLSFMNQLTPLGNFSE